MVFDPARCSRRLVTIESLAASLATCLVIGCGVGGDRARGGGHASGGDAGSCAACTTRDDCSAGEFCAQFGGDSYCAPPCASDGGCPGDRACAQETTVSGLAVGVCVPRGDVCAPRASPVARPGDAGKDAALGAFPAVAGHIGPTGGAVSRLYFAVIGDTRPAHIDDIASYPTAVIGRIFRDVQSLAPPPPFAVATGDYVFASTAGAQAGAQLDLYVHARRAYAGVLFPAMGNHECAGATASNCGPGGSGGLTDNYRQFMSKLLEPLGLAKPYYAFDVVSLAGQKSWTAKFLVVAANAWDAGQASWFEAALSRPTTYTFVVRHEPASASAAPGVGPTEEILGRYPYTLCIVGHSHTYERSGPREVVIGNGGAPLTSSTANYGFGLVQQRPDGAIEVDVVDYATMRRDTSFTFAVKPDGSPAP